MHALCECNESNAQTAHKYNVFVSIHPGCIFQKALDRLAKLQCFGFDWVPFLYSSLSKCCATNTLLLALMVVYPRIPSILSQAPTFSTSTGPYMWGTENPVLNLFPTAMLPKQQGNRHVFNEGIIWKKFHLSASLLLSVVTSCFCYTGKTLTQIKPAKFSVCFSSLLKSHFF